MTTLLRLLVLLVLQVLLVLVARPPHALQVSARRVRLALDPWEQPESPASSSSLANTSLSPWTYRECFQEERVPSRIYQAQCLTSGCLGLQGEGGQNLALEARPIYYQVLVLHRVRRNKKKKRRNGYKFKLGTEMITVGCTCVRPSVVPQH